MVFYGFFKVVFDFRSYPCRREIYHDFKRFFERKFINGIVDVLFCFRVEVFFSERSRVKRIKKL
ncbi:hypothetical protein DU30_01535 [Methanosarcina mazei]|uniref:Uncharacterized protein n=1 Tax=Methanosarcina mazei TaxID=2209 RepID=A0A0F8EP57_METMZ|nr:hypothetical protein DU30_01535 [Methanosarcina mazei]